MPVSLITLGGVGGPPALLGMVGDSYGPPPATLASFVTGTVVTNRVPPVAAVAADPAFGVIGSVVKLNGQHSYDPSELPGRSGDDSSTVASGDTISAPSGEFTTADLGRIISLVGVDAGSYLIVGILATTQVQVVGSDGSNVSFSGGPSSWSINDQITFAWAFVSVPIGSNVVQEGFRALEPDGSLVSFSPDVVGDYVVQLTVSNPVFTSVPASARVSVRALLVPYARGIVPDGKFIWQYLRDVWQHVEGKEFFETFWSALIQIVGGELLKLYQNDYNKSIRDIQDLYQRRWLSYEPELELDGNNLTLYIGNQLAGSGATTRGLRDSGQLIITSEGEFVVVEGSILASADGMELDIIYDNNNSANARSYTLQGVNNSKTGYKVAPNTIPPDPTGEIIASSVFFTFAFQSPTWSVVGPMGPIQVGDVINIPSGINAGYYRIVSSNGIAVIVDRTPPQDSSSLPATTVYRPVTYTIDSGAAPVSNSFAIPTSSGEGVGSLASGRVLVVGDQTFTLLRSELDSRQAQKLVVVTTDGGSVLTDLDGLSWRVPHTLASTTQNFEDLGVSAGDLLTIEVTNLNNGSIFELPAQVVGVDRYRLGFVLTDEAVQDGTVPIVPPAYVVAMASEFGIKGAALDAGGGLVLRGDAANIVSTLSSGAWQRQYFNQALGPTTQFSVLGGIFTVLPKSIRRNRRIPIDPSVVSIPALQDWIVQPATMIQDGVLYQTHNGQSFEIPNTPFSLIENSDFTVDGQLAVADTFSFDTGSDVVRIENGRFTERDLEAGDTLQIISPESIVGSYYIQEVLSSEDLLLSRPLPDVGRVTAKIQIYRRLGGAFIRFVQGGFTAKHPAPKRLWAEETFFDNSGTIENNFGILVELKRSDLEAVSSDLNYRQAVAGLMFAYTKGPAAAKMRLGAQILLGLPFAEHAGIIRSIENDYRLDINGTPILGRVLIEDTDNTGKPAGITRIYTYPVDPISDLAGLDINPATGEIYVVGDSVTLFAALSKGVEVDDYMTKPLSPGVSPAAQIQQFNSFRIRANDTVFSLKEFDLLSKFLKNISPSYVAMIIATAAEIADSVAVDDRTIPTLRVANGVLSDTPYFGSPTPEMFDVVTLGGYPLMISDVGFFQPRMVLPDLAVVAGVTVVLPRSNTSGEGLLVRVGDYVYFMSGPNTGLYTVSVVSTTSGVTTLTLDGLPAFSGLQPATQNVIIMRQVAASLRSGTYTSVANVATVATGLKEDYVGPGDLFLTDSGDSIPIISVGSAGVLTLLSAPVSDSGNYNIVRKSLLESPYLQDWAQGTLVSNGSIYTSLTNGFFGALLEAGDEILVTGGNQHLQVLDPTRLGFVPVLPAGTYTVSVCKRGHYASPVSVDHIATLGPGEQVDTTLISSTQCTYNTDGTQVLLGSDPSTMNILPGDFLILNQGGNSTVDVGYGPGVYPIVAVSHTAVVLAATLSSGDVSTWSIRRRS